MWLICMVGGLFANNWQLKGLPVGYWLCTSFFTANIVSEKQCMLDNVSKNLDEILVSVTTTTGVARGRTGPNLRIWS